MNNNNSEDSDSLQARPSIEKRKFAGFFLPIQQF